jgi:hypothetical protein
MTDIRKRLKERKNRTDIIATRKDDIRQQIENLVLQSAKSREQFAQIKATPQFEAEIINTIDRILILIGSLSGESNNSEVFGRLVAYYKMLVDRLGVYTGDFSPQFKEYIKSSLKKIKDAMNRFLIFADAIDRINKTEKFGDEEPLSYDDFRNLKSKIYPIREYFVDTAKKIIESINVFEQTGRLLLPPEFLNYKLLSPANSTSEEAYRYFLDYYNIPDTFDNALNNPLITNRESFDEYREALAQMRRERDDEDDEGDEMPELVEEVEAEDAGAEGPPAQQPRERRGVVNRVLRNLFMGQGPDERRAIDDEAIARRERERAEGEAERGARRPRPGRLGRELDAVGFGTTEKKKRGRPKKSENKRKNKK